MSATIINRNLRWRKAGVGEGPHGDTRRRLFATVFGVKHCCAAYRAEPKLELRPVVADPHVLGGGTENLIGRGEAGQRRENAAGPALTCEAVANANAEGFARNFNAQLPAGTRSGSRTHSAPRRTLFAFWSTRIRAARPARPTGNHRPLSETRVAVHTPRCGRRTRSTSGAKSSPGVTPACARASRRLTIMVSPSMAASNRARPARSAFAPLVFSRKIFSHQAAFNVSSRASRVWPSVETRAEIVKLLPCRNPPIMQILFV